MENKTNLKKIEACYRFVHEMQDDGSIEKVLKPVDRTELDVIEIDRTFQVEKLVCKDKDGDLWLVPYVGVSKIIEYEGEKDSFREELLHIVKVLASALLSKIESLGSEGKGPQVQRVRANWISTDKKLDHRKSESIPKGTLFALAEKIDDEFSLYATINLDGTTDLVVCDSEDLKELSGLESDEIASRYMSGLTEEGIQAQIDKLMNDLGDNVN
jgi:hypothetical protein